MATARVIDAAVRFLRTNPELVAYAQASAPGTGLSVEEILRDAVGRLRAGEPHDGISAPPPAPVRTRRPASSGSR